MNGPGATPASAIRGALERLSPRQRQYAMLAAILAGGVGLLWLIFAFTDDGTRNPGAATPGAKPATVTNIGVMPPGQQVNPVDQWVGTAGSKLAQYEAEREEQSRLNRDRQTFEAQTMKRFAELEQRLTSAAQAAAMSPAPTPIAPPPTPAVPAAPQQLPAMPPAAGLSPPPARGNAVGMPPGVPGTSPAMPLLPAGTIVPPLSRVTVTPRDKPAEAVSSPSSSAAPATNGDVRTVSTFLPVSFTRGILLGGLDVEGLAHGHAAVALVHGVGPRGDGLGLVRLERPRLEELR